MKNIPRIGFGTWRLPADQTRELVTTALDVGYTHIDCAAMYGNEVQVGQAVHEYLESHDRQNIWITSKIWHTEHSPANLRKQCLQSIADLQCTYLDCLLWHWPLQMAHGQGKVPRDLLNCVIYESGYGLQHSWREMELLVREGLVRHIGFSNTPASVVLDVLNYCEIRPICNQIEAHPFFQNSELVQACCERAISTVAYSPLGGCNYASEPIINQLRDNPELEEIQKKHGVSLHQLALAWHLNRADLYCVIPKSSKKEHMQSNLKAAKITLTSAEMAVFAKLDTGLRQCCPIKQLDLPYFD